MLPTKFQFIWLLHANSRETKIGRVGGGLKFLFQKDAKWCILLHFGYKICVVKTLNIV